MLRVNKREQRRARQRREQIRNHVVWGGVGLVVLAVIGFVVWQGIRPAAGESFPIMTSSPHIATDTDPGDYNSDPPTSGLHYAEEAQAGFYDTNIYTYPAAYLVHNLEHGYVIFWYNCDLLSESACSDLKSQIKTVIDDLGGTKLIAYPYHHWMFLLLSLPEDACKSLKRLMQRKPKLSIRPISTMRPNPTHRKGNNVYFDDDHYTKVKAIYFRMDFAALV
jgi:hypothetical protein